MLQLDFTTVSAARMCIKFHCMSCLYVYGNTVILSYLILLSDRKVLVSLEMKLRMV